MIVGFVTQTPSAFQDTELPNVGTINVTPRPQGPKLRFGPTDKLRVFFLNATPVRWMLLTAGGRRQVKL